MNRQKAKEIAETVSNQDLRQMFLNARTNIKDWDALSIVNKGLSKGIAFNILSVGFDALHFDPNATHGVLAKRNMVREFGEYLPEYKKESKQPKPSVQHSKQDPKIFN